TFLKQYTCCFSVSGGEGEAPLADTQAPPSPPELRMVLLGKTGAGKSAAGNTILGREEFRSEASSSAVTRECEKRKGQVAGRRVAVIDTPELSQDKLQIRSCVSLSAPGPHAFLLVIPVGRFTEEERRAVETVQEIFSEEDVRRHMMLLFTHSDKLKGKTIEDYIQTGSKELQQLVEKCGKCEDRSDRTQVTQLLDKIDNMVKGNNGSYYTSEMYQQAEAKIRQRQEEILKEKEETILREEEELRAKHLKELENMERKMRLEIQKRDEKIRELEERIGELEEELWKEQGENHRIKLEEELRGKREERERAEREKEECMEKGERERGEYEEKHRREIEAIRQRYQEIIRPEAERANEFISRYEKPAEARGERAALGAVLSTVAGALREGAEVGAVLHTVSRAIREETSLGAVMHAAKEAVTKGAKEKAIKHAVAGALSEGAVIGTVLHTVAEAIEAAPQEPSQEQTDCPHAQILSGRYSVHLASSLIKLHLDSSAIVFTREQKKGEMAAAGSDPGRGIMAAEQEAEETVSQELHSPSELRIVLIGRCLTGKSTAGNIILNREEGRSGFITSEVTEECENRTGEVSGRRVTVVDTPDLLDTDRVEIERCVSLSAPGPHAFLLVMQVYTKKSIVTHRETVVKNYCKAFDKVQELFGERAVRNMMILFTCGDDLRGRTIEQHIEEAGEELQQLVEKCGNRCHVLNNEDRSDGTQVTQLLDKIDNMVKGSGGCYLPNEIYQEVEERIRLKEQELNEKHKEERSSKEKEMKQKYEEEQRRREEELMEKLRKQMKEEELEKEPEESKLPVRRRNSNEGLPPTRRGIMAAEQEAEETVSQELHSASELRIVLLGRERVGKSASGNTILGREEFRSGFMASTRTKKGTGEVSGRRVTVVDTPEIFKTNRDEIERCVSLSAPGPHAFLLVIPVKKKKTQWRQSVVKHLGGGLNKVQELFGERAVRNTMILFTFGDRLKGRTIEQHIEKAGEKLQQLFEKCGNRYHVLNNKNRSDRTQVTQLLDKIDNMVKGSGGCYLPISSEIYQEVEERIRLKEQELNEKHKEELSRIEDEMKQKYEEEQRRREEKKQKYEEEQRRREEEMKQKYEEEQRRREEEMKQKYEEEQRRREEEMKQKYEEEQRRREEMKQKYEEEQRRREEMKQKYEEEQRRREEMKQKYEEEQRRREEMKQKYEEEQRRREEMKQKYEEEQRRREEELMEKLRKQMKEEELEKEAEEPKLPVRRRNSIEGLPPDLSGGEGEAPLADTQAPPSPPELRMVLLGKTGAGKSAAGNTILGREEFRSEASSSAVTRECEKRKGQVAGRRVAVINTPELSQDKLQIRSCVSLSALGPHDKSCSTSEGKERARNVRIRKKRDEQIDRVGYEKSKLLKERPGELELQLKLRREMERSRVLERELKRAQEAEQELKKERKKMSELEEKLERRRVKSRVLEWERKEREKVELKREKGNKQRIGDSATDPVLHMCERATIEKTLDSSAIVFTREQKKGEMAAAGSDPGRGVMAAEQEAEETVSQELHSASELRIVLLGGGKTGKSVAGNILGRKEFKSGFLASAKTKKECEKRTGEVSGRRVTVVDTPDLLHTDRVEIERCVSLSAPGPHAFLLLIPVKKKKTQWRQSAVKHLGEGLNKLQELFGERAVRNTMILFTHGDVLTGRTIEQHIEEAGEELQQLVEKCGNRYHVLNNKNRSDRTQVTQLLDKIDSMVKGSGGCFYKSEMYLEVKEQELNDKHKEELSRKEKEIKQKYEEEQRMREEEMKEKYEEEQRREEEMKQKYEEEQRRREEEMKQKYEEEQRRREEEMKQKYEEEQRTREEEMKQKYEEEQRRREEELMEKLRKQMKEEELEKEAEESKLPVRRRHSKELINPTRRGIMAAEQEAEETVSQELHSASELRIVLLGGRLTGKSTAGNTILGREEFRSGFSSSAGTKECEKRTGEVSGRRVTVVDTPRWFHTDRVEFERCVSLSAPGPHAFLLVIPVYEKEVMDTLRESIVKWCCEAFDKVQGVFGERAVRNTMVLFTRGDYLEGRTIEQHIEEAGEELQQLVEKCGNRYHVLNTEDRSDRTQVTQLLDKIDSMVKGSGGCYTMEMYLEEKISQKEQELKEMKQKYVEEQKRREEELTEKLRKQMKEEALEKEAEESKLPVRRRKSNELRPPNMSGGEGEAPLADNQAPPCPPELRMVLLGKTGAGKSAAGNNILDGDEFRSGFSSSEVTRECEKRTGEVSGRRVTVVDTPDLLDTDRVEIERCVSLSAPGPHAFLLVIPVHNQIHKWIPWQKTEVKNLCKALNKVHGVFGERAVRNTMILFTWGDHLRGRKIEQYIEEAGEEFQQLVGKCGNRYHVLSNEDRSDRTQVTQLLDKIDNMVKGNNGSYYTSEMYQQAEERAGEVRIGKKRDEQIDGVGYEKSKLLKERPGELELQLELRRERERSRVLERELKRAQEGEQELKKEREERRELERRREREHTEKGELKREKEGRKRKQKMIVKVEFEDQED
ncbi:rootletin-like, partial [Acipenser ruthenus]|uniref:rootletin-like n=1 Tax=Acipenser ruthenus TaxID=7906 RepID=UPI0027412882